ncbi:zinc finger, CCHC-type containing protein [Tanacetum coccineum]
MGDENPIRTLEDYSKPSHEGYRNTIELPKGKNVVPLLSDTIRLVQNGCSFHGLRSEDLNQHLKDFLKLVDSLNLDVANRERTRLRLFQFSLRDQAISWLERLPVGSISTWEDLTTRFLAQFFPPGRTVKLCNDILMFQQHQGESLSEAWTYFKDLLQKVPHHGIDLWLKVQYFMTMSILPQDEPSTNQSVVHILNSFLESFGLVPQSSDIEFVCTKGDDEDIMFIEIIRKNDDSREEELKEDENTATGGLEVVYFDTFLTRSKVAYHKNEEDMRRGVEYDAVVVRLLHEVLQLPRSVVLTVSSPNEPKSRVILSNAFQM